MVTHIRATTRAVNAWHARIVALALIVLLVGGSFQLVANLFATSVEGNAPVAAHPKLVQYHSGAEWLHTCTGASAHFLFGTPHRVYIVRCAAAVSL